MKPLRLAATALLAGGFLTAVAMAQGIDVRQTALESDFDNYVIVQNQSPASSPSDRAPGVPAAQPATLPVEEIAAGGDDEGFRLFQSDRLDCRRITVRGWLDQGFTWNPDSPANRFNGPVAYNDRSNEYQLNQFYMFAERLTNTDDRRIDFGGRIDMLYGTDHRFPTAVGLDDDWGQNQRFYGLAMPQLYGDVAFGDWVWRTGHMLSPAGYENVMSPENFFYSHSYQFLYAQPTTITSSMLTKKLNDNLSVNAGVFTGWNNFESQNDKAGFYGGANWKLPNEKTTIALEGFFNNQQPSGVESSRSLVVFVLTHEFNDKLKYVLETNVGYDSQAIRVPDQGRTHAEWFGLTNYLFYQINPCWSLGARFEWFSDEDGTRVAGKGAPHGIPLSPVASEWSDVSFGVRYTPNNNVIVRSELRWDWNRSLVQVSDYPFDDFSQGSQFLWGTDLIIKF
jgi:hypothetical protein